ncbi:MAG: Taurine dioxygenase [Actinomycetia bacterium]|nr:Taurine dioxygenase [Actinomycetes bacterium]
MTVASPLALGLDVRPLSRTIGAEIRGVDLHEPLSREATTAIRNLLLEHKVIFFPGQHLEPAEHVAFARNFGELTPAHPVIPGVEGFPELFEIDYTLARTLYPQDAVGEATNVSLSWHTDVTFMQKPPFGSILNAKVIPPSGGDTSWADQHAAFTALSPTFQSFLSTLTAVHSGDTTFGKVLELRKEQRGEGGEWEGEDVTLAPVEHPVVRTHPETGLQSLFVNPGFTRYVKGLSAQESDLLLGFLYAHSTRPEFTVRYHWTAGDVAFWDNRVTQHAVLNDFGDQHRVIQRVTLHGDVPV